MKKDIIIIFGSIIVLAISIFVLVSSIDVKDSKESYNDIKEETIIEEDTIIEEVNNIEEDSNIEEKEDNSNSVQDNYKNNNNNNNNNNSNNQVNVQEDNPVTVTYSCPEGYILNGTKCFSTVDANYVCPPNSTDYSNNDIPRDKYCVNLSQGYESETDSCPSGYGLVSIISFGGPTKYSCLPLLEKIYTCDEGDILEGTKCIKIIDPE